MLFALAACGSTNSGGENGDNTKITDIGNNADITLDNTETSFDQDENAELADAKI